MMGNGRILALQYFLDLKHLQSVNYRNYRMQMHQYFLDLMHLQSVNYCNYRMQMHQCPLDLMHLQSVNYRNHRTQMHQYFLDWKFSVPLYDSSYKTNKASLLSPSFLYLCRILSNRYSHWPQFHYNNSLSHRMCVLPYLPAHTALHPPQTCC